MGRLESTLPSDWRRLESTPSYYEKSFSPFCPLKDGKYADAIKVVSYS